MRFVIVCALVLSVPGMVLAQQARPSIFAVDTVAAIEESVTEGDFSTGLVFDSVISADLSRGFQAIIRPIAQRRAGTSNWNNQIWMATLRYERSTPALGVRVDAGLIPSPIGLATLGLRPQTNPTISQPSSLFSALPALELRGPRTNLLGAMYPFGAQVTVSGPHWDARAAFIDMSPLRPREVFAEANPPRFANAIVGAGITPFVGLRLGVSAAHGGWQRAGESPANLEDRNATIVTVEGEFAFRYTKLTGEWTHDSIETSAGTRRASGWFLQGQQTLAPRLFVAGRVERISAPALLPGGAGTVRVALAGIEGTLGFRLTPEITVRVGHRARRPFAVGAPGFDHQSAVSVVWWRRWL
jgi:hypothetical protein